MNSRRKEEISCKIKFVHYRQSPERHKTHPGTPRPGYSIHWLGIVQNGGTLRANLAFISLLQECHSKQRALPPFSGKIANKKKDEGDVEIITFFPFIYTFFRRVVYKANCLRIETKKAKFKIHGFFWALERIIFLFARRKKVGTLQIFLRYEIIVGCLIFLGTINSQFA